MTYVAITLELQNLNYSKWPCSSSAPSAASSGFSITLMTPPLALMISPGLRLTPAMCSSTYGCS